MANISNPFGTMTLEGPWTDQQIKMLVPILQSLEPAYYNTIMEDIEETIYEEHLAYFIGNGRWSFQNNLESFDRWIEDPKGELAQLRKEMEENKLKIVWDGTDYEGGFGFIYTFSGFHEVIDGKFIYQETEHTSYDYNVKELYERCGEDYYFDEEFIPELRKKFKLNKEDDDALAELIQEHPTWYGLIPYQEDVPEELLEAVKKRFNL